MTRLNENLLVQLVERGPRGDVIVFMDTDSGKEILIPVELVPRLLQALAYLTAYLNEAQ